MPTEATIAAEANADLTLWCVHTLGSDDVEPMPSHAAAVEAARRLNEAVFSKFKENDVLCFSYAAPWPHDAAGHAEYLARATRPAPDQEG